MNLGQAIKFCRIKRGLNQLDVAKMAGISDSYLSLLEGGERNPNFSTVLRIASALNVSIVIITFLADEKDELLKINPELAEKLSYAALQLNGMPTSESTGIFK